LEASLAQIKGEIRGKIILGKIEVKGDIELQN
jgi:hypothetical protein